jgi:hypothetical protein
MTPGRSRACRVFPLASLLAAAMAGLTPAAALAVVPVTRPTPVFTPVVINALAGDQYDPHVSGAWAVYTDDIALRYHDFATGTDAEIPRGDSARDLLSEISGSKIVFSRVFTGSRTAMMIFDPTGTVAPVEIAPSPGTSRIGSAIGGNTVAYIDFGLQASGELVIHDLATSLSVRITNDTAFDQNPAVAPGGDVVTWEHCASSLSLCDIWQAVKSGTFWTVSATAGSPDPDGNPDSNGSLIVYNSLRSANADILWRPVSGGAEVQLQMSGFEGNPNIAGDFIAFESRTTLFENTDIYVYDRVNNWLYQITSTPLVTEQLNDIAVLPDGRIRMVWAGDEDGFDQRNIHAATFALPDGRPALSYPTAPGYGTDGVSPELALPSHPVTYKVVYTDLEDEAPSFLHVCIDGACASMSLDTGAPAPLRDGDHTNGEQYAYTTTLLSGAHVYRFEGSDGTHVVSTATATGPTVSGLVITSTSLPDASVGTPYATTLTAADGIPPYAWAVSPLPPGLGFGLTPDTITGVPTAPGVYSMTITAGDAAGAVSRNVTLTVAGAQPPHLHPFSDIIVRATSPAGRIVSFSPQAEDKIDPNPIVLCNPASGSVFPIGKTIVVCVAINAFGVKSAQLEFRVFVEGAREQIRDLAKLVKSTVPKGIRPPLLAHLDEAAKSLKKNGEDPAAACRKLAAFMADVRALLSEARGAEMVDRANQIRAVLGCGAGD